mmetsp:Transcript_9520/g.23711  ORF Transcript_9520/g.23711 Transcript_9520/m.23711 type:complete len:433 (+) Transcript_9520:103-1401(+)
MWQHSSTRVLVVGLTSCVAIVSIVAYNHIGNGGKVMDSNKSEEDAVETTENSDDSDEGGISSKPMFDHKNSELARTIVDMADQRAKRWMSFQVTGAHCMVGQVGGKSHNKKPILILETFVMKPVNPDHRGIREISFYEAIQASSKRSGFKTYCDLFGPRIGGKKSNGCEPCCDDSKVVNETKLLHRLEPFTPRYFGTIQYDQNSGPDEKTMSQKDTGGFTKQNSYILLNNITTNFSKPSVLDIKLGTETFEPDAPDEKKAYELKKYPPQSDFGFRLTAMRIYEPTNPKAGECGYVYYPKQYGRTLETRESIKQALVLFLGGANLPKEIRANRSSAIQRILQRLKLIKGWFCDNNAFQFCGSSILIVYEGDAVCKEVDGIHLDMGRAKMIDFGRVRRNPEGDMGYLRGVTTLIILLEEILRESFLGTSKYIRF